MYVVHFVFITNNSSMSVTVIRVVSEPFSVI